MDFKLPRRSTIGWRRPFLTGLRGEAAAAPFRWCFLSRILNEKLGFAEPESFPNFNLKENYKSQELPNSLTPTT
jgi:hypothetical protein